MSHNTRHFDSALLLPCNKDKLMVPSVMPGARRAASAPSFSAQRPNYGSLPGMASSGSFGFSGNSFGGGFFPQSSPQPNPYSFQSNYGYQSPSPYGPSSPYGGYGGQMSQPMGYGGFGSYGGYY